MRQSKVFGSLLCLAVSLHVAPVCGPLLWAQGTTDKRLLQKTTLDFDQTPLQLALQELCDKHKLKLAIDAKALADEGLALDVPLPELRAENITLASALNLISHSQWLAYHVEKGTLYVTPRASANRSMTTRTFPLADLGPLAHDSQSLSNALQSTTLLEWEELDDTGGKFLNVTPQSITIEQTQAGLEEIDDILQRIAAVARGKRRAPTVAERADDLIRRSLAKPAELPAGEMTLRDLSERLRTVNQINVVVDYLALKDAGIDPAALKLTLPGKKQPLGQTITHTFAEHGLAWTIGDEVLLVTSKVQADKTLFVRIYDLRRQNRPVPEIVTQIQAMQDIGPWEEVDGIGGVIAPVGPLLLVCQHAAAHDKLETILGAGQ